MCRRDYLVCGLHPVLCSGAHYVHSVMNFVGYDYKRDHSQDGFEEGFSLQQVAEPEEIA